MRENTATGMSAQHGCNGEKEIVVKFKEALMRRVGPERFRMWFTFGVRFDTASGRETGSTGRRSPSSDAPAAPSDAAPSDASNGSSVGTGNFAEAVDASPERLVIYVSGQFALDRLNKNFAGEIRAAAAQVTGGRSPADVRIEPRQPRQVDLPLGDDASDNANGSSNATKTSKRSRRSTEPPRSRRRASAAIGDLAVGSLINERSARGGKTDARAAAARQLDLLDHPAAGAPDATGGETRRRERSSDANDGPVAKANSADKSASMTADSFVIGPCNRLAHTGAQMVCGDPGAASPLFVCGPTGVGKTHLLTVIADCFRRRHRMRRVMHLSAEVFANEFIASVGGTGITSFRRRYRDVDALLIDDVHFLSAKKATIREMLFTLQTLSDAGRPMVFSSTLPAADIPNLSSELAGRFSAGLVCPIATLDVATRRTLLRRRLTERLPAALAEAIPAATIDALAEVVSGDGRVIGGVVNQINLLAHVDGRVPHIDTIRDACGGLLRIGKHPANLSSIEAAVCEAFALPGGALRATRQTRSISGPRMLAMYLARQLTSSAYSEIARHFGGKSHSTAIAAEKNVNRWLDQNKPIGRGPAAMSTAQAIEKIEQKLTQQAS